MLYYVKWAYCADLTTGVVDASAYGMLSLVGSMMMFLPLIVGTIIATPLMKLAKSAMRLHRSLMLVEGIVGGALFVLHIVGILPNSPVLFFALVAQFSSEENSEAFRRIMTGTTGACVCLIVLGMAIHMIISATKQLKEMEETK